MPTPLHKNFCLSDHEIFNFGRPFLGHYYYVLSLSHPCRGIEKKNLKEIMHFHFMCYMVTLKNRIPAPRVMKFTILVDPTLVTSSF